MAVPSEPQAETYNPWSIVNLVFHHLADQGLHPILGESGDPGEPAAALLRAWDGVAAAVRKMQPNLVLDGMLVEAMAPPGLELVFGARREPKWGPILTIGLGGIWIEALHDIRILPADIDHDGIIAELQKLKGAALLRGGRGTPAADLDAVADCVLHLGAIVRSDPRVTEIEINPLRVYAKGALALDVLMQVE